MTTSSEQFRQAVADLDEPAWAAMEQIGRTFHVKGAELAATLQAVLGEALALTEGTRDAGVNLYLQKRLEPQAVLGAAPPPLDALQRRTDDGPCVASSRDQQVVRISDLETDERWPEFRRLALDLGIRAMLCLPLWIDDTRLGSLSLYSDHEREFSARDERVGSLLATHAALALSDALRAENLRRAIASRDLIGQAKGILMERHRLTDDGAFARLVTASQQHNLKVSEVAERLVRTGALPGP